MATDLAFIKRYIRINGCLINILLLFYTAASFGLVIFTINITESTLKLVG